jgi:hypothetical protein
VGWDNVNLFLHMSNLGRVRQIHPKNKVFPWMQVQSILRKLRDKDIQKFPLWRLVWQYVEGDAASEASGGVASRCR